MIQMYSVTCTVILNYPQNIDNCFQYTINAKVIKFERHYATLNLTIVAIIFFHESSRF